MKKLMDWLYEWLPQFWGFMWTLIVTAVSVAFLVFAVKLLLNALGVL